MEIQALCTVEKSTIYRLVENDTLIKNLNENHTALFLFRPLWNERNLAINYQPESLYAPHKSATLEEMF